MRRCGSGGGPGGYTAAIRAAQLGPNVVCVEAESELGGTCLRVGCIPTKAWVQTAHWLKQARESFEKLGVVVERAGARLRRRQQWKRGVVAQMTGGVASLFKANGVDWLHGRGSFKDANTLFVEGSEEVHFDQAIIATGSFPIRPPIPASSRALRRLDRPAVADRGPAAARDPRRRHHRVRVRLDLRPLRQRGHGGRDARPLIPQEDEDAAKELQKALRKRGIKLELGKQCTAVEEAGRGLTVRYGEGEPSRPT